MTPTTFPLIQYRLLMQCRLPFQYPLLSHKGGRHLAQILAFLLCASASAHADLIFSEYVEGSSNNKALEVYNTTGESIELSNYQVSLYFNGNNSAGLTIPLQGSLAANDVYVLAHSNAVADILMLADQQNGAGWFNGDDTITLAKDGVIIDTIGQIGLDPGTQWGQDNLTTANKTLRRKAGINIGDANGYADFDPAQEWDGFPQDDFTGLGRHITEGDPNNPEPSQPNGRCGEPSVRIHQIQGSGDSSPHNGETQTVEAVVVGDFQGSDGLNGFFLQERDNLADTDPTTAEGILIFQSGDMTEVNIGDLVRVTGNVNEYFGMTQITATAIGVCGTDHVVAPATLQLPFNSPAELEALEGMAVTIPQTLTVSENYNLSRFGELVLSAEGRLFNPTQIAPPGEAAAAIKEQNQKRRILLDDGSARQNPANIPYPAPQLTADNSVRAGDTVTNLRGVLHYAFNEFRLQPTVPPIFIPVNPRVLHDQNTERQLRIGSFNVLNYFNGDGLGGGFPTSRGASTQTEFARQRDKILAALAALNADVLGLIEIENDGYDDASAIQDLIKGLSDIGHNYQVIPSVRRIGTDEIAVGILYKPTKVRPFNGPAILDTSVDSRFIDSKNRPVLAQTFIDHQGAVFTFAVAHLKSKGSNCDDIGDTDLNDGQGNCNRTRTEATKAIADWLRADPTNSNSENFLLMGDLNAYAKEDPIVTLENAGLVNLIERFIGMEAYTYAGYLDHALASNSLAAQVIGVNAYQINADEPRALDYNEEFKTAQQISEWYSPSPWRSSDHDPLMVKIALANDNAVRGDFDFDQKLTGRDLSLLAKALGKPINDTNQQLDLNGDDRIGIADILIWTALAFKSKQ